MLTSFRGARVAWPAFTEDEWYQQLSKLIRNVTARRTIGQSGRLYIEEHNAQHLIAEKIINAIKSAVQA